MDVNPKRKFLPGYAKPVFFQLCSYLSKPFISNFVF